MVDHIDSFDSEEELNEKLDKFTYIMIGEKINIDAMHGEIGLPKVF